MSLNQYENNALQDAGTSTLPSENGPDSRLNTVAVLPGRTVKSRLAQRVLTFLVVMGPGLIVMEADNDAGAVSTYTQAGAQYGTHLLWLMVLLLPLSYFVQEMVARLGIATGEGHATMIYQRFGKWWGRFSLVDLLFVNFLTLVTEFAAISLAFSATRSLAGHRGAYRCSGPRGARDHRAAIGGGNGFMVVLCLLDLTWLVLAARSGVSGAEVLRSTRGAERAAGRCNAGIDVSSHRDCRDDDRALAIVFSAELCRGQAPAFLGPRTRATRHVHRSRVHHHRGGMHDARRRPGAPARHHLSGSRADGVGDAPVRRRDWGRRRCCC